METELKMASEAQSFSREHHEIITSKIKFEETHAQVRIETKIMDPYGTNMEVIDYSEVI